MEESKEKYNPINIEPIKRFLEIQHAKGKARYYEIYVGNLKVVERTNDPNEFDSHEEFINERTKEVRILLYSSHPTSPRVLHRYNFSLVDEPEIKSGELNGIDIETRMNEKMSIERERWATDLLKKELEATKEKLLDADEYIEKLQSELEKVKSKKLHLGDVNLGELASVMVEGMIRRNPQMLAKLPGGEVLAGVITQDNKDREQTKVVPETQASFKKASAAGNLSEDDKKYMMALRQMEEYFDEDELKKVLAIIHKLASDTKQIDPVAELLEISINPINN